LDEIEVPLVELGHGRGGAFTPARAVRRSAASAARACHCWENVVLTPSFAVAE